MGEVWGVRGVAPPLVSGEPLVGGVPLVGESAQDAMRQSACTESLSG